MSSSSFGRRLTEDGSEITVTVTPILNREAMAAVVEEISATVAAAVEAAIVAGARRASAAATQP